MLSTMAAYIDLNPVRAGIVKDPKDYRWSGYGDAVAGKRLRRAGLMRVVGEGEWGWAQVAWCAGAVSALSLYGEGEEHSVKWPRGRGGCAAWWWCFACEEQTETWSQCASRVEGGTPAWGAWANAFVKDAGAVTLHRG